MSTRPATIITWTGGLTGALIGLKLAGLLSWSWLWVLSPTWLLALAVGAVFAVAFIAHEIQGD